MKRFVAILLAICFLTCFGCGDTKFINGVEYDTYGIINAAEKKNPDIQYRVIFGNVVWSIILVETIIAPIYFLGFDIMEPVGKINPNKPKGAL